MEQTGNIFVGIDFSIISPGVCIMQNDTFKWISVYSAYEEEHHKLLKKKDGPFNILDSTKTASIFLRKKKEKKGETYSQTERNKIVVSVEEVAFLIKKIKEVLDTLEGEVFVAMEGVSYSSQGNILLDIGMATGILRKMILEDILDNKTDNFYVFSPMTIKKFAGSGKFKKNHMYDAMLEKTEVNKSEFVSLLEQHKSSWVSPGGSVKAPISDLVDAGWISLLTKKVVENEYPAETVVKVKKSKSKKISGVDGKV